MVPIEGIDGLAHGDLEAEIARGGRFVFFESCVSLIVMTTRRPTHIVFLRRHESGWLRALPYTLLSLLLGWWGLPWGIIYTPLVVANNLAGGCDVTREICERMGLCDTEVP